MKIDQDAHSGERNIHAAANSLVDYDGPPAPEVDEHGYKIREQPMGTKKKLKVILMGAGASSLNFFKKAEEEMENLDIVCYEKNHDVGGTWVSLSNGDHYVR